MQAGDFTMQNETKEENMSETMMKIYNTLTPDAQQEVRDFMMFLAQKKSQQKETDEKQFQKDWGKILDKYIGSTKGLWADEDPLEYQKRLREDREIG